MDSPVSSYTFDGVWEGIAQAPSWRREPDVHDFPLNRNGPGPDARARPVDAGVYLQSGQQPVPATFVAAAAAGPTSATSAAVSPNSLVFMCRPLSHWVSDHPLQTRA